MEIFRLQVRERSIHKIWWQRGHRHLNATPQELPYEYLPMWIVSCCVYHVVVHLQNVHCFRCSALSWNPIGCPPPHHYHQHLCSRFWYEMEMAMNFCFKIQSINDRSSGSPRHCGQFDDNQWLKANLQEHDASQFSVGLVTSHEVVDESWWAYQQR